jgi:Pyruvate/2-oxoacid:ferredoxin oxidoreductase delta subunit
MNKSEYLRAWCAKNREKVMEYHRNKRLRNPEQYKAIGLRYRLAHKEEIRARQKKYRYLKYGWTKEMYQIVYQQQEGRCAICSDFCEELYIDHDHFTNSTRGLLCKYCNWGLGHFKDSVERLEKAVIYLRDREII